MKKPTALLFTFAILGAGSHAATIQIDLGYTTSGGNSFTTPGWNNFHALNAAETANVAPIANLIDTAGANTGFGFAITTNGLTGPAGNATGIAGLPSTATVDAFFGGGTASVFTLSSLNPTLTYSFKFYSAVNRGDSINRTSRFTINGQQIEIQSLDNPGLWTSTISGISPDINGNINITVSRGTGNTSSSYLINIIQIETVPEPTALLLSALGFIPLLRRRR